MTEMHILVYALNNKYKKGIATNKKTKSFITTATLWQHHTLTLVHSEVITPAQPEGLNVTEKNYKPIYTVKRPACFASSINNPDG